VEEEVVKGRSVGDGGRVTVGAVGVAVGSSLLLGDLSEVGAVRLVEGVDVRGDGEGSVDDGVLAAREDGSKVSLGT
jgi:hypothetical protein